MKRLKEWWRNFRKALDDEVDAHIEEMLGEPYEPDRTSQEISGIITELESITERLRKLI